MTPLQHTRVHEFMSLKKAQKQRGCIKEKPHGLTAVNQYYIGVNLYVYKILEKPIIF